MTTSKKAINSEKYYRSPEATTARMELDTIDIRQSFSAEESENLRVRSDLMISLRKLIQSKQWSLDVAALNMQTTIDCVQGLLAGDIDRFQVEPLMMMLNHANQQQIELAAETDYLHSSPCHSEHLQRSIN